MRSAVTYRQFDQEIFGAQRYAWRWEQQPAYDVDYESSGFQAFLAGHPQPPDDNIPLISYYQKVGAMARRGVEIGRVRIVDTPPTDYQRWTHWMDRWNKEAGENIHYLSRTLLRQMGQPPFAPHCDWWLIDGERLLIVSYAPEHPGRPAGYQLVVGEPEVRLARLWRLAVVSWAIEEESASTSVAA